MSENSILDTMGEFSGRMLLTIKRGADDLFKKKLNDGLMILVGSAVAHFDPAKENKNVFAEALSPGSPFPGPGFKIIVERTAWQQVNRWMAESFSEACTAGIDIGLKIWNIDDNAAAHAQGSVNVQVLFSYIPEELSFMAKEGGQFSLLMVAKKLQEAWLPQEDDDDGEG